MRSIDYGYLVAHLRESRIILEYVRDALLIDGDLALAHKTVRAIRETNITLNALVDVQRSRARARLRETAQPSGEVAAKAAIVESTS